MNKRLQLTIYLNEADRRGDLPLYEEVLRWLLHSEIAGATVFRASMGFGKHAVLHRRGLFGVSDDHPLAIVVVDEPEKIRLILPLLRGIAPEGFMTVQEVELA
ncbi:MAG: DUF190 domain-containing protein [Bryobacteraceae bacterium]|nr:DUF190 domain-containing protein [Bryobacteraceae bacterium]MDW8378368.1 DUF190 domain-containing protein [Bryobacterales bacterium]